MTNSDFDAHDSDTEVRIDLSTVTSEREVHELFARSLRFPDFYGHNWDAFWDVLTGFDCFPRRLIVVGAEHLLATVPRAYEKLHSCFADCEREHPDVAPAVTWQ